MTINLEVMFSNEYIKYLNEKEKHLVDFITSHTVEPTAYAETVGYLRALRENKIRFEELLKAYFAT